MALSGQTAPYTVAAPILGVCLRLKGLMSSHRSPTERHSQQSYVRKQMQLASCRVSATIARTVSLPATMILGLWGRASRDVNAAS
jgi:hypothetical protein